MNLETRNVKLQLSDFEGKEWVFPRVATHLHGNSLGTPHIRPFIYSLQEL